MHVLDLDALAIVTGGQQSEPQPQLPIPWPGSPKDPQRQHDPNPGTPPQLPRENPRNPNPLPIPPLDPWG